MRVGTGLLGALALAWRAGWHTLVGQAGLALLGSVLPVALAWLTKLALDGVARPAPFRDLLPIGLGLAAVGVGAGLVPHLERYARQDMQRRTGLLAQDRLFAAAEGFVGLARFEAPAFLDRLRLAHQAGGIAPGAVVAGALGVGRGLVTVLGFLGALFLISPWLAVAVVAAAAPALAAELALSRRWAALLWRIGPVQRRESFYQQLLTSVQAAKELRLFGVGRYLRERMATERRTANAEHRTMDRRELRYQSGLGLLAAVTSGVALLWALHAAARGSITAGDVALLVAAVAGVQAGTTGLVTEISTAHQQLLLFGHYRAVLASGPDLPTPADTSTAGTHRPAPLRVGIEFRDVWFRYSPDHPWTLRGLDLTIPYGRSVALLGRNGAGKSTVVKLLCRLYDPDRGAVLWDGVDLRDLDPAELRRRIGAVFQDFMEYDLSAADNIGLGDLDALGDESRISAAARRAGVHDTITNLPRGYQTLLSRLFPDDHAESEDGATSDETAASGGGVGVPLSGGQWQRLALARAYLRGERDLLILDEPSAGLDAEAEYDIHVGLRQFRAGRTSLLVSHRLGAVRDADLLVVLDGGRVVEQGDHATLLRADGRYAQMFQLQAQGYLTDSPHSVGVR
ncbi:ABC transporter ATP-binding protein [Plantactinospora sp. S1510]|uniref:ABC transporter ATP-binding protein n=2 Tax=Plantactinospora alkalitolerans TaxID=2789879 RepID=A0ABS0GWQ2_9ACTN|nr:ABC transporter ATP-binding protein [Plantactinospora alkalitolerans]